MKYVIYSSKVVNLYEEYFVKFDLIKDLCSFFRLG